MGGSLSVLGSSLFHIPLVLLIETMAERDESTVHDKPILVLALKTSCRTSQMIRNKKGRAHFLFIPKAESPLKSEG